jgi:hypothetical protein
MMLQVPMAGNGGEVAAIVVALIGVYRNSDQDLR